jgi:RNA polymerase sigma-70 factor (ECF subfamily)
MLEESEYHISKEVQKDEKLIIELAKKDMKNFAPLYNKYYEQIFHYCYQRLDTKEKAFDVTSQVFLKAMTNLHQYTYKGVPFTSWLYRIAKSELGNEFKKNKKSRTINITEKHIKDLSHEINEPENDNEVRKQLMESLSLLNESNLSIVEMRFFERRSFKEIGEILDITENNAKVKLYRALDKLKVMFQSKNFKK